MAADGAVIRVLGPVQLLTPSGAVVELPSASQRRLLGVLAIHAPRPVRADWLCRVLEVSSGALRTTVARLRRTVGEEVLHNTATGYCLSAPVDAALACAELLQAGGAPELIRRSLARWVGPALDEFRLEPWALGEVARLDEVHASAVEDLADALVAGGRPDEAIAVLEPHVAANPFRDRPRGLLIRALAAAGRRTEALRRYQEYRSFLGEQVGTEPSAELRRVEERIASGWDGVDGHVPDTSGPRSPGREEGAAPIAFAPPVPLVGRHEELHALRTAAAEAATGGPRVALVTGEAGMGKTALVAAFATSLVPSPGLSPAWLPFYDRCDEFIREPFQPFRGLLGQLVDHVGSDVLLAHASSCGGDLARLVPQLEARVPLPASSFADDPGTARHLLFQAAVDLVRRAAAVAPLVLVLDDLHWAEPTSLHLFTHLVRGLAGAPVVFAATYRDTGEATGDHLRTTVADLVRLGATRVELAGLDQIELGELVHARVTATAGHDVGPLAAQLRSETAGNPLFAEHLLKHWSESAKLDLVPAPRPGEFAGIAVLPPSDPGDLPATIRDLVWRRAGVLGGDARSMLGAAAVLGVEFEERIVATMTGLSPEAVDDLLDRAVSAGLVTAPLPAASTSRFTHALFARALETELGVRTATRLHAAAFDALLETLPAASTGVAPDRSRRTAARLVHHAECAGRIIEARRWAQVAGDDALADLAAEEAVGWFQRALDHADALGVADGERADLVVRLGDAQYRAGHPAGLDTVQQGAMLAERSGNDEALVRAALATDPGFIVRRGTFVPQQLALAEAALARVGEDDLATRARLHALIAQTLAPTDRTARRTAAATSALELARACGDPRVVARVAPNVLLALWAPGAAALRSSIAAEATEIAESLGDPSLAAGVYQAAYSTAVCIGDAAAEQRYRQKLRDIAEEIAEPRVRWMTGLLDCFVATMAGRFREAEALAAAAFDLGNRIGEPNAWTAFAGQTFVIGTFEGRHAELLPLLQHIIDTQDSIDLTMRLAHAIVCVEVGDTEAATALLAEAMAKGIATIPQDFMRITVLLGYAVLALELGDVEVAGALLPELVGLAGEVSFNGASSQGPVAAYVGKLLSLLGRHAEAECHLTEALSTTEAFGWEYHRATTLFALAHNRVRATGALDPTAAGWLDGAEELCARHGIASWARRARALRER